MVFHATLKDLAKGFIKVAGKEVKSVRDALIQTGRAAAIQVACSALENRTGLPNRICSRVGSFVVDEIVQEVKQKLSR